MKPDLEAIRKRLETSDTQSNGVYIYDGDLVTDIAFLLAQHAQDRATIEAQAKVVEAAQRYIQACGGWGSDERWEQLNEAVRVFGRDALDAKGDGE
jgi:DNA repair exonuclease SbcCD ATPase subunit